jgi:hypothetical protein
LKIVHFSSFLKFSLAELVKVVKHPLTFLPQWSKVLPVDSKGAEGNALGAFLFLEKEGVENGRKEKVRTGVVRQLCVQ